MYRVIQYLRQLINGHSKGFSAPGAPSPLTRVCGALFLYKKLILVK